MQTFKSFAALAAAIEEAQREQHRADIEAANRLRRARSLPRPKIGPRIAR